MKRALALIACACGCDSGFSIGVTVERGCLPVPATLKVLARARPHGEVASSSVGGSVFFAEGGQHRAVVIPPPDAQSVDVTVVALDAMQVTMGDATVNVPVAGHALVEETLTLAGTCNDGFMPLDLSTPDMAVVCHANGDCGGQTPYCDTMTGRCAACLPPNTGCAMNEQCVQTNGDWGCKPGCTDKNQCMGASPDCCGGACVDTASDPSHCGGCANACDLPNAMAGCANGNCTVAQCTGGFTDCDGDPKDGCEADTMSDKANCGGCAKPCLSGSNVTAAVCQGGMCLIAGCNPPFADCDGVFANGCEANTDLDGMNCGTCGHSCNGATCLAGQCAPARRVFITGFLADGVINGTDGADLACQASADAAQLGGKWQAWISDINSSPNTRFMTHFNGPYLRLDGKMVAPSWTALLANGPLVPINLTPNKQPPPASTGCGNGDPTAVWTATSSGGDYDGAGDCAQWNSNSAQFHVTAGSYSGMGFWSQTCQMVCSGKAPLYCFEQ